MFAVNDANLYEPFMSNYYNQAPQAFSAGPVVPVPVDPLQNAQPQIAMQPQQHQSALVGGSYPQNVQVTVQAVHTPPSPQQPQQQQQQQQPRVQAGQAVQQRREEQQRAEDSAVDPSKQKSQTQVHRELSRLQIDSKFVPSLPKHLATFFGGTILCILLFVYFKVYDEGNVAFSLSFWKKRGTRVNILLIYLYRILSNDLRRYLVRSYLAFYLS